MNYLIPTPFPILSLLLLISLTSFGGTDTKTLKHFDKVVVSPYIEVELTEGEEPGIRLEYDDIDREDINVEVSSGTLRVFLSEARVYDRTYKFREDGYKWRRSRYKYSKVKAYITYKTLRSLQIRGEQKVVVKSPIKVKKFKLKLYGESDVRLKSIEVDRLKVVMIGENDLKILDGTIGNQKYRSYGENIVDARSAESVSAKTSIFGESDIRLNVSDMLSITSFGESTVLFRGDPLVHKGIVIGHTDIARIR